MFGFFKREELKKVTCKDNELVAMANGKKVNVKELPDDVFAKEMMGPSIAFKYDDDKVTLCAPCSGKLTLVYPTGHAFGITNNIGIEILTHIGIDSVTANGDGFKVLKKQDEEVVAGEPIIVFNNKKLSKQFNMSTILIILNSNGYKINFKEFENADRGSVVCTFDKE